MEKQTQSGNIPLNIPYECLVGKKVLVTGAGVGIGRSIAEAFARQGAIVALHYSRSADGAKKALENIRQAGGRAKIFQCDFPKVQSIRNMAREVLEFLGGIDILVNNAGITLNLPIEKITEEQFDLLYAVNTRAPFFLCQSLVSELKKSRGVIINISSIHAYEGCNEHSVYAGTRGAIVAFTRQLSIELAPKGVRVVGIAPGAILTEKLLCNKKNGEFVFIGEDAGRNIPAGFIGRPDDVAAVALFLASPYARYIIGQTLVVDGGTTSWMPFGEQFKQTMDLQFGHEYVKGV